MYVHGIRVLFPFPGYVIEKGTMAADIAQVVLRRDRRFRLACPACGATMAAHRTRTQTARDLALGTARLVVLTYPAIQGRCCACGACATVLPPGIDPHAKATRRLMHFVCRLARYMPLGHIPEIVAISERTAGRWDRKVLREHLRIRGHGNSRRRTLASRSPLGTVSQSEQETSNFLVAVTTFERLAIECACGLRTLDGFIHARR